MIRAVGTTSANTRREGIRNEVEVGPIDGSIWRHFVPKSFQGEV